MQPVYQADRLGSIGERMARQSTKLFGHGQTCWVTSGKKFKASVAPVPRRDVPSLLQANGIDPSDDNAANADYRKVRVSAEVYAEIIRPEQDGGIFITEAGIVKNYEISAELSNQVDDADTSVGLIAHRAAPDPVAGEAPVGERDQGRRKDYWPTPALTP